MPDMMGLFSCVDFASNDEDAAEKQEGAAAVKQKAAAKKQKAAGEDGAKKKGRSCQRGDS